jgi:uncharacterized OB-fold protein
VGIPYPEQEWRAHLEQGRFMLQRSDSTGEYVYYPRVAAPGSGADDLEWTEVSGNGTVYAVTIVRRKPPEPDYNVVLVDLAEGPRMMSRVVDCANEDIRIGDLVQARIDELEGQKTVVFVPAGAGP